MGSTRFVADYRPGTPSRHSGGQAGFALLELLIGGTVLAVGIIGIALMFSEGQSYAVADGDDRVALALAQQKLEHVRSLGFSCIPPATSPGLPGDVQNALEGCPGYTGTPSVPDTPDAQAARTYNETTLLNRYASRVTRVRCVDPADLTVAVSGCDLAKIITVEVTSYVPETATGTTAKTRGVRVETILTWH